MESPWLKLTMIKMINNKVGTYHKFIRKSFGKFDRRGKQCFNGKLE